METTVGLRSRSFTGGIHPPERKGATEQKPIEDLPLPPYVVIPVQQHIGAPSKPIVEKGAQVRVGDPVSEASGYVSVPAHASISGTVIAVENRPHPLGPDLLSVVIERDGEDRWREDVVLSQNYLDLENREMLDLIRAAGLAGLGGAAFPTHVKLSPPADKPIDTLLLNGAECEPYLTSDHRLMVEEPDRIVLGMQVLVRLTGASTGVIGIEKNKTDAIAVLRKTVNTHGLPFRILSFNVKYPQGAEKQLIRAATGREVPSGGLPMDVGCVVQNVGTSAAVYDAVASRRPLIDRIVTVTGPGINEAKNLRVRIGTPYSFVFEGCGGLHDEIGKIIMGGPMMGVAQHSLDIPVIKGTSGIVVLERTDSRAAPEMPCISCARCVDVCPMRLMPKMLGQFVKHGLFDRAREYNALDCIECGSCAYVCPAHINLVHLIRYGKSEVMRQNQKKS